MKRGDKRTEAAPGAWERRDVRELRGEGGGGMEEKSMVMALPTPTRTCSGSEKCAAGVSCAHSCSQAGSQGIASFTGIHLPTLSPCTGSIAQFEEDSKAFIQLFTFDLNRTRKLQEKG